MFLDLWILSFALLSHSLFYPPSWAHNHPGSCQSKSSRARVGAQSWTHTCKSILAGLAPVQTAGEQGSGAGEG